MSCVQGRVLYSPRAGYYNHSFLDLQVLTALSVPPIAAAAHAGVTHFKPRLTSKGSLPMLVMLNSLGKCNWRMAQ